MKAADLPLHYNMCAILEHNLETRAEKTAVLSNDGTMTFGDVSRQVNQVGNALLRLDVRFGDCVAILSPDRPEWVTAFFAATKIGGIALGMNTLLKTEEYDYILGDSRARVLIVHDSLLGVIEPALENHATLKRVIVIGDAGNTGYTTFSDWIDGEEENLDAERTHRDDFCSLHYSSGTTGMPKGVLHAHKDYPLIAQLSGVDVFGMTEDDRTFSVAKLFFVYGIGDNLIFPVVRGRKLRPGRRPATPGGRGSENDRNLSADHFCLRAHGVWRHSSAARLQQAIRSEFDPHVHIGR